MPPEELNAQAWHDAMNAKFFTYVHMIDLVVKKMGARGRGSIVNVVGAGGKVASPIHMPGGAANAALMLISAGMAAAYGPRGVRVNAVNPGATHTERLEAGMQATARMLNISAQEALAQATGKVPLGRLAQPQEVANVVLFLASERASYVTGVVLTMDGAATPMVVYGNADQVASIHGTNHLNAKWRETLPNLGPLSPLSGGFQPPSNPYGRTCPSNCPRPR